MCLYPKLIRNPKYKENGKNRGNIPPIIDSRVLAVPVGCGRCMECRQKKGREWTVRLQEEIKTAKFGKFVTLTFSNENIRKLAGECKGIEGYELDNAIATLATRRFLERWRKKYKRSVRHFLVTELGHNGTENIHMHGIIWTERTMGEIEAIWQYGFMWKGYENKPNYVNTRTVSYIVKYITKIDEKHKGYMSKILTSPGMGAGYEKRSDAKRNQYRPEGGTDETFRTDSGHKIMMPVYYRNKIYTDEERERLWIEKLNKGERWVCGEKVEAGQWEEYFELVDYYRGKSRRLGYGDDKVDWKREEYELQRRRLLMEERTGKPIEPTAIGNESALLRAARKIREEERLKTASGGVLAKGLGYIWEEGQPTWKDLGLHERKFGETEKEE